MGDRSGTRGKEGLTYTELGLTARPRRLSTPRVEGRSGMRSPRKRRKGRKGHRGYGARESCPERAVCPAPR